MKNKITLSMAIFVTLTTLNAADIKIDDKAQTGIKLMAEQMVPEYKIEKPDTIDHNREKKQKEATKIMEKWINNPLICFGDVSGTIIPKCIKSKEDLSKCQLEAVKKIDKVCKTPLIISITDEYNKNEKVKKVKYNDKKLPDEYKKYTIERFEFYKEQMYFMIGYTTGYTFANIHRKEIEKKKKELLKEIKNDKK